VKKQRHILVIDDEPTVTQAVVKICGAEGLAVTAAELASVALDALERNEFRLVLCDIMMPEVNGFQFLEELALRGINTPVVMMTGYSTVENAVRSMTSTGAIDYIPKPFTADELLAVVQRSLRSSALLAEAECARLPGVGSMGFAPCPSDFHCLGQTSWALIEEEGTALVGVSDLFVKTVGGITHMELSPRGEDLLQGISCAEVWASDGLVHNVMCPLSGQILEVNARARETPSLLERDPFFRGWLYRILPSNPASDLKWLNQ
jgi:CheY-like chemotaxis protein/glycine cleavage system H lipoate-binding protein